ncbi:cell envelope integrity EipB family protein [Acidiphilium sp. AL]|uniref:Cell envelope integrity EipB family protein n=1 Tax=Acidiphilium iwatense TaxID=768198 RepID=A0ABS9DU63_9PROT|nr:MULTISPECIES: DUF1849 family protein [Acidiphilium]MCF3946239.1 cell envelope integrity EipB family protein [Acidiphilium iwatense]MCU4158811.1 cell envelope integrity EipB family protein [Acidiphilium sp. AL]
MKRIFLTTCGLLLGSSAFAASPVTLTGQNATYTLSLSKVRGHSVTGATGRLRFDVLETCRAYTVSQHMTLLIRNQDGSLTRTISDYDTWESKSGHRLTFLLRQSEDGKTKVEDQGTATTGPKGGVVNYTVPKGRVVKLPPGTLFPMAHTRHILEASAKGEPYIDPPLFDGTSAHGAEHTFVAILGRRDAQKSRFAPLAALPSTLVDIGFFRRKPRDEEPDFRTQMRYYTNGVSRDVRLDFGNFVLHGKLTALTIPPVACPSARSASDSGAPRDPKN